MVLIFYYKVMLKKGNDATNPAILSSFFVTKRTKLDARMRVKSKITIEWKKSRLFLENHSLELGETWNKGTSGNK